MPAHCFKQVAKPEPKQRTVRELVTLYGDDWARFASVRSSYEWGAWRSAAGDGTHDWTDYLLMKQMERGELCRCGE